jgi:pimeloyl-ACP methyl ester carboxylesterase
MTDRKKAILSLLLALTLSAGGAHATAGEEWPATPPAEPPADWGPVAANFEDIAYPWPVRFLKLHRFRQDMLMAYMDVPPTEEPNGQTVFLQHGMNFYSEAYADTIAALAAAGFRVIAVDRIGYGKSSKPVIPYDFNFVAANMKALLEHLQIDQVALVGHSMGGMVVSRFAMLYPDTVTHVVMVNQIGLTDRRQGRAWRDPYVDELTAPSYRSILEGHRRYFPNEWPPQHLKYVKRQYGQTLSGEWPRLVMVRRLQAQMLYEDPVVYDWQHIPAKALVIGGEEDGLVEDFPALARNVADRLQNGTLLLYPDIGHAPHVEIPDRFHADLIRFLRSDPDQAARDWRQM